MITILANIPIQKACEENKRKISDISTTLISLYSLGKESALDQNPTLFSINSNTVLVLKMILSRTISTTGGIIAPAIGLVA